MRRHLFIVIALIILSSALTAQGHWTQKADCPYGEFIPGFFFSWGNKIYVAKPRSTGNDSIYSWNQSSNVWTFETVFPGVAKYSTAVAFNGKAYVVAGSNMNNNVFTKQVWELNISTNTWTQKLDFPGVGRVGHGLNYNVSNGLVYLTFGYIGSSAMTPMLTDFWAYNSSLDTWSQLSSYSVTPFGGRAFHCSYAENNTVGIVWGSTDAPNLFTTSSSAFYNISAGTWTAVVGQIGVINSIRRSASLFKLGNYFFGGFGNIGGPSPSDDITFGKLTYLQSANYIYPNFPGTSMSNNMYATLNGKGYVGLGTHLPLNFPTSPATGLKQLWEFNPTYCKNDSLTIRNNTFTSVNVMSNDEIFATNYDPATFAITSPSQNGVAVVTGSSSISYTPGSGFVGIDIIDYVVCDSLGNCDTAQLKISVIPGLTVSANPQSICSGQTATLTASGLLSYTWMPGTIVSNSITVSPSVTTTFSVIASDAYGIESAVVTVTSTSNPSLDVVVTPSAGLCPGQSVTLTTQGLYTSYTCNNIPFNQSIVLSPMISTTYTLTGSNAGCNAIDIIQVLISQNINAILSTSLSVCDSCSGAVNALISGGVPPYSFSLTPGNTQITMPYTQLCNGLYKLYITDSIGCTNYKIFSVSCSGMVSGLSQSGSDSGDISIFPNPASGEISIHVPGQDFNYRVYNSLGQSVSEGKILGSSFTCVLPANASGLILIEVFNSNKTIRKKIFNR